MEEPTFFNPFAEIEIHGSRLPHWQQAGATYFVTFRLADSLPRERIDRWKEDRKVWLQNHPKPWTAEIEAHYRDIFSDTIDRWLDNGSGNCLLREREYRDEIETVMFRFDDDRTSLHSLVVMPNHVHALVSLSVSVTLPDTLKGWKGTSARRINQLRKSTEAVWSGNYFDRLIRDQDHFFRVARYIRNNPQKANLSASEYSLRESESVEAMLRQ